MTSQPAPTDFPHPRAEPFALPVDQRWKRELAAAIRDPETLADRLRLDATTRAEAVAASKLFPIVVPESYLDRMRPGDPTDPLLRQVLPVGEEFETPDGYTTDPLGEQAVRPVPGLLHKYPGRVLLIATGICAVHCRYCFRRHYPYGDEPVGGDDWEPALDQITSDDSIREVILSGGDPLTRTDAALGRLLNRLDAIPHLTRLRIHTRLPIVLPSRINRPLVDSLTDRRLQPVMVVHANHPHEISGDCALTLRELVRSGIPTLNQTVLLRGINDRTETQRELCERLIDLGVLPYYLHCLDRVSGAAHFETSESIGRKIVEQLRSQLPGYAVPTLVREIPGEPSKTPL